MDTPNLLVPIAFIAMVIVVPRLVYESVGRTGDVIAQLFVPPDRALGWPHGVQESDEPWGWHDARSPTDPDESGGVADDDLTPIVFEIVELPLGRDDRGLIVEVGPVRSERPHRAAA